MRYSLTIDDAVVQRLKEKAAHLNITVSRLAEVLLVRGLCSREPFVLLAVSEQLGSDATATPVSLKPAAEKPAVAAPLNDPSTVPGYDPEVGF